MRLIQVKKPIKTETAEESEALGWGLGAWDGALKRPKSCFVKEGFKLAAKTGHGRTVSNIQGKG